MRNRLFPWFGPLGNRGPGYVPIPLFLDSQSLDREVAELEGLEGLGMSHDALRQARKLLKKRDLSASSFIAALGVLLANGGRLKRDKPLVVCAYQRLNRRAQRAARFWMLSFHHSNQDWAEALHFVPKHFRDEFGLIALMFSMDVLVELDRLEKAALLAPKLRRAIKVAANQQMKSFLRISLAEFLARTGEWRAALDLLADIPDPGAFTENVYLNRVELHLVNAVAAALTGLRAVQDLRKEFDPELELRLPDNNARRWNALEKELRRTLAKLLRIIPPRRLARYGIQIEQPKPGSK
jgi:hypothetical protein